MKITIKLELLDIYIDYTSTHFETKRVTNLTPSIPNQIKNQQMELNVVISITLLVQQYCSTNNKLNAFKLIPIKKVHIISEFTFHCIFLIALKPFSKKKRKITKFFLHTLFVDAILDRNFAINFFDDNLST